ncbi:hypothetical protein HKX48_002030 [Thoreauomyces humboldtii]|nr:hypothetical protein HKX48_002030 [Thoreauomyces humboldtii]
MSESQPSVRQTTASSENDPPSRTPTPPSRVESANRFLVDLNADAPGQEAVLEQLRSLENHDQGQGDTEDSDEMPHLGTLPPERASSESDPDSDSDQDHEGEDGGGYWCHQCQDEISPRMDSGIPTCDECGSEFVEEIELDSDPRRFGDDDEDDGGDYLLFEHPPVINGVGGTGIVHTGGLNLPLAGDPGGAHNADVARILQSWLQQMVGEHTNVHIEGQIHTPVGEEGHAPAAEALGEAVGAHAAAAERLDSEPEPPHARAGQPVFGRTPRPGRAIPVSNINGVPTFDLAAILEGILGVGGTGGPNANPLQGLFNMHGNPGDYVFGERGLDDVISQLMEQTGQRNSPPPATEQLIASLPQIQISKSDLVEHADCAICQDEYTESETVTALPCKHLFHPLCIEHWLKVNGKPAAPVFSLR